MHIIDASNGISQEFRWTASGMPVPLEGVEMSMTIRHEGEVVDELDDTYFTKTAPEKGEFRLLVEQDRIKDLPPKASFLLEANVSWAGSSNKICKGTITNEFQADQEASS